MKVHNLIGTSKNDTCKCGSWLKHWENYSDESAVWCSNNECLNDPEVGGHVQKEDSTDKNWYIIPLCYECNKLKYAFELREGTELIPANVSKTCG